MPDPQILPADRTLLDLIVAIIAVIVLPGLAIITGKKVARTERSELKLVTRYVFIALRGIVISILVLLAWGSAGRPWTLLGLDMPVGTPGRIGLGVDVVLIAYYTLALVRNLSGERADALRARFKEMRILPETNTEFALFPLVVLCGSTAEELLYRGFLIWFLTPLGGVWPAVIMSSVCFGIGHAYQGGKGILRTGLIGLAIGAAYALSRSLWWLIIAHITVNLFGGLFAWRLRRLNSRAAV